MDFQLVLVEDCLGLQFWLRFFSLMTYFTYACVGKSKYHCTVKIKQSKCLLGFTIAVVEDNEIMADKIKKILLNALALLQIKDSEYQLDIYYDGESVITSGIDYDISFLDVNLGLGIDGFEVGRKMNETYKVKPLLVVLTNFTDRGEDSYALRT